MDVAESRHLLFHCANQHRHKQQPPSFSGIETTLAGCHQGTVAVTIASSSLHHTYHHEAPCRDQRQPRQQGRGIPQIYKEQPPIHHIRIAMLYSQHEQAASSKSGHRSALQYNVHGGILHSLMSTIRLWNICSADCAPKMWPSCTLLCAVIALMRA